MRYHKEHKHHKSLSIACVVDDFGDQGQVQHVSGGGGVLNRLAIRGRHYCISFFIKSQRPVLLSSTLRTQCSAIYCFAQRSQKDLDILLTELSALVPRRILERIYRKATERKYNFLMVDLLADSPDEMFFWNLDKQIVWRTKSEQ